MRNGSRFEKEVLGVYARWSRFPKFVPYEEAIEMALRKQPNDHNPLNPREKMGRQLLNAIRSALAEAMVPCDERDQIVNSTGLYSAVGTAADYWHRVDAIVCCDLGYVAPLVTIDLKARPDEGDEMRADHIVLTRKHFLESASNNKMRYENLAGVVADCLLEKLEKAGEISYSVAS